MTIHYIEATIEDLPTIVNIYNEAIPTHQSTADLELITVADREDWFHSFDDTHPIWLIYDNDQVVGWVALEQMYGRAAYKKSAEIAIYLTQTTKGKGIGSQTIEFIEQTAKRLGLKSIAGYVLSQNIPSQRMFQKAGFDQWGFMLDVCEFDGQFKGVYIFGYHPN